MKIGLIAAAAVALSSCRSCDPGLPPGRRPAVDLKADDMVHGKANAPVTIIEYASMTCPHCARLRKDVIPQLTKDYIDTGKVETRVPRVPAGRRGADGVCRRPLFQR